MTIRSLLTLSVATLMYWGAATDVHATTVAEGRQCVLDVLDSAQRNNWSLMQAAEQYISFESVAANGAARSTYRNLEWENIPIEIRNNMVSFARSFFGGRMYNSGRQVDVQTIVIGRASVHTASGSIEVPGRFTNEYDQFEHFTIWVVRSSDRCFAVDVAYQGIRISLAVAREF